MEATEARTAAGTVLPAIEKVAADADLLTRFWSKTTKGKEGVGASDCWEWTGCRKAKGYGKFRLGLVMYAAHRLSYALKHGAYPDPNLMVLHSCDNPTCCNPAHLSLGTALENNRQIVERGHHRNQYSQPVLFVDRATDKGKDSWTRGTTKIIMGRSKLIPDDVLDIRRRVSQSTPTPESISIIAAEYGVSYRVIQNVVTGRTFPGVTSAHGTSCTY